MRIYNRNRRGKSSFGFSLPLFTGATKSLRTMRGKYIVYVIVICSLIGIAVQMTVSYSLKKHEVSLKGTSLNVAEEQMIEEQATLITGGVIILLLIASLLSMNRIIKIIEKRRTRGIK